MGLDLAWPAKAWDAKLGELQLDNDPYVDVTLKGQLRTFFLRERTAPADREMLFGNSQKEATTAILDLLKPALRPPRQLDALSLLNRSASMFATIRVINDHKDPAIHLEAEVMVDSGCEAELILPKRKMQQLQLDIMDTTRARGFGDAVTDMIVYRAVRVEVDLTDETTGEVLSTTRADLVPQSKSSDPDSEPSHQDARLFEFAGLRGQAADGGVVKLSPVKRNRADTAGLLGFLALHKLKLRVDPENYQLLRVTEDELIV